MLAVTSWFVGFVVLYVIVAFGNVLSIQVTFAIAVPVFPAGSIYLKVNSPFSVNVWTFPPSTITSSLSNVTVALISSFVGFVVLYVIVATGAFLSIQVTFAIAVPIFPAGPMNANSYSPFSVNVCVFPPSTSTLFLSKVIVAITSRFVNVLIS